MKPLFIFLLTAFTAMASAQNLPITEYRGSNPALPLICYITGDGGINAFSKNLIQAWNNKGYSVIALNSKSYFWKKQTPEQAATDISSLLVKYLAGWKCPSAVLMGYSLGADVLPFIQNRLPAASSSKVSKLVMLSPSATTDFEVHLFYGSSGSSVPAEINKLAKPTLVFFGQKEKDTPEASISSKYATVVKLPGDHHYDDDTNGLVQQVVNRL